MPPKQMSLRVVQTIIITSFVIIQINASDDEDFECDCDPMISESVSDHPKSKEEWTQYKVLHGYKMHQYRYEWNTHANESVISAQQRQILRSETIPIDGCMASLNMSLDKNKIIQQLLAPFLVNSTDDKIRMFKNELNDAANKSFVVFEIGNQKITNWMNQIRRSFPCDQRFHPHFTVTRGDKTEFQIGTSCPDQNLMAKEFELVQAQLDVVLKTHQIVSNNSDPKIRYLTNWVDITMSKWLQKKVYHESPNYNASLSEIKDIIEAQTIHTDFSYDLTFALFMTSDNYETGNGFNSLSHEQGLYLVPETNKKYLLKLHKDRIILAIFPSKMIHFTQYVNVKDNETVHNVFNEMDRIWRLSTVMQTVARRQQRHMSAMLNDRFEILD
eukprot:228790_1